MSRLLVYLGFISLWQLPITALARPVEPDDIFDIIEADLFALVNLTRQTYSISILDPTINQVSGVSYWVNSIGQAVQYGDMIWGPEELLVGMGTSETSTDEFYFNFNITFTIDDQTKRSFTIPQNLGWKDGIIRYRFRSTVAKNAHEKGLRDAISEWKSWAPYLTFDLEPIKDKFERDIVTISSIAGDGCHSNIAWSRGLANDKKQINFDPEWDEISLKRAYIHELGHQLGLFHEHMRPDRNNYVAFDCSAVQAINDPNDHTCNRNTDCCKFPKSACCHPWVSNFEVLDPKRVPVKTNGPYDYASIMHYASSYFAKPGQATLTKKGVSFDKEEQALSHGQTYLPISYHISRGDAVAVCQIYSSLCTRCFPSGVPMRNPLGECQ